MLSQTAVKTRRGIEFQPMRAPRAMPVALRAVKRKLYVPNNASLYNAACAGFLAGVFQGKDISHAPETSFTSIAAQGQIFAEAVDLLIPPGNPSQGQIGYLRAIVQSTMADKYSVGLTITQFRNEALAVVNLYASGSSSLLPESAATAVEVSYNDVLVGPPLGATNVQGAIDALKGKTSAGAFTEVAFSYDTPSPMVLQAVTPGQTITRAQIVVGMPFNDPDATVEVGTTEVPGSVLEIGDTDLTVDGASFATEELVTFVTSDIFIITISPGSSTQGAGTLYYWIQ